MAFNDYITLLSKTVAILPSAVSINGIAQIGAANRQFGTVYYINGLCDRVQSGQSVGFNSTNAMLVTIGTQTYFIVDEDDIKFIQKPPL